MYRPPRLNFFSTLTSISLFSALLPILYHTLVIGTRIAYIKIVVWHKICSFILLVDQIKCTSVFYFSAGDDMSFSALLWICSQSEVKHFLPNFVIITYWNFVGFYCSLLSFPISDCRKQ